MDVTTAMPVSILRGGTSRGVFFRPTDLPPAREDVEKILLDVLGSPDKRQINGLGGATSLTSKVAIVGPSATDDADVDYTFAQVDVTRPIVDWGGNCGNISSAVGPFAIDTHLVSATEPMTTVRIRNVNTQKIIVAHVPVVDGHAVTEGSYAIAGVPGTGARIGLDFVEPGGSTSGKLLPTGNARDWVTLPDGRVIEVSLVDAANPVVFVRASDLLVAPDISPAEMEAYPQLIETMQYLRGVGALWLGLVDDPANAWTLSPGLPKVSLVSPWTDRDLPAGSDFGIVGRVLSMGKPHQSFGVTHGIATGAAARIDGTLVNESARLTVDRRDRFTLAIGHPTGVMDVVVSSTDGPEGLTIDGVEVGRTARHILDGTVWLTTETTAA